MKIKNFKLERLLAAALVIVLAFAINSCSKNANPGPNQVYMQNTAFNPTSITVAVNATVTWTNKDNMDHNVTSDAGLFASSNIISGGTYSHQFTAAGTYPYHCTIHPGMNGTVVVQ